MKPTRGNQFAGMPFDLSHDASLLAPAPGLIAEGGVIAPHIVGQAANGSCEQIRDVIERLFGVAQVRGVLPARIDRRLRGVAGDWRVDRHPQYRAASFRPRRPNAGGGLRSRATCRYDGKGY